MPNPMLDQYVAERDANLGLIRNVMTAAHDAGRDLSDQDQETITRAKARNDEIDKQLQFVGANYEMDDQVRSTLARHHPEQVSAPFHGYSEYGEVLYDMLNYRREPAARDRYDRALAQAKTRAAQHMGTVAADTTATAGDVHGIIINPIVGPIVDFVDTSTPLLNAIGTKQAPAYTFNRPYLTDAAEATGTTAQTAQKAELPSTALTVNQDPLTLKTYGEYLNVSQQLISLQPQGLQVIVNSLRNRVQRGLEKAAFTELALSTSKITLADATVTPAVSDAIWDAAATVYAQTGAPAEWILMGPTGAARLGKVADSAGRPLYPLVGPANAPGQLGGQINGLTPIVSYAVSTVRYWVGNRFAFEAYTYPFPMLDQAEPSVFGRQISVATGAAFYRPRTVGGQIGPVQVGP